VTRKKALIIGIDGVPRDLLQTMIDSGVMPGLAKFLASGYGLHPMKASLPDISSVSWTSFMTGENPGIHGIFGFTDLKPNSYLLTFPNSTAVKASTFWNRLHQEGKIGRSVILNVPNTYPAPPLQGLLVSGFVAIDFNRAVYPPSYIPWLKGMKYIIDVDMQKATDNPDGFYQDLCESLSIREAVATHLFDNEEHDLFLLCITETDRLHHFFFDRNETDLFREFYGKVGAFIHRLFRRAQEKWGDDLLFIVLSDHGFTLLKTEVNLNAFLAAAGILKIDKGKEFYEKIQTGTVAFAMDPGRIYIHKKGRYPNGHVEPEEVPVVKEQLGKLLSSLRDAAGNPIIRHIFDGNNIYHGPLATQGPDLVLIPYDGYDLKGNMRKEEVFTKDRFTGMHTWNNASLIIPEYLAAGDDYSIEMPARFIRTYFS
jgi:predicted AlkP superfamily phosphohydrolase/phosphomutase